MRFVTFATHCSNPYSALSNHFECQSMSKWTCKKFFFMFSCYSDSQNWQLLENLFKLLLRNSLHVHDKTSQVCHIICASFQWMSKWRIGCRIYVEIVLDKVYKILSEMSHYVCSELLCTAIRHVTYINFFIDLNLCDSVVTFFYTSTWMSKWWIGCTIFMFEIILTEQYRLF